MYIVQSFSESKTAGYTTVGEVYTDEKVEKYIKPLMTAQELKSKLDSGESIVTDEMIIKLLGEPAVEDFDKYRAQYEYNMHRDYAVPSIILMCRPPMTVYGYTREEVIDSLNKVGVREDESARKIAILAGLRVYESSRHPEEYKDEITLEELLDEVIRLNRRGKEPPYRPADGTELWRIKSITDYYGNDRMEPKRRAWVGSIIFFSVLKRGYTMFVNFVERDGEPNDTNMWSTTIIDIKRGENTISATTRNGSIYNFERLKNDG
jgi:hypothetical protein